MIPFFIKRLAEIKEDQVLCEAEERAIDVDFTNLIFNDRLCGFAFWCDLLMQFHRARLAGDGSPYHVEMGKEKRLAEPWFAKDQVPTFAILKPRSSASMTSNVCGGERMTGRIEELFRWTPFDQSSRPIGYPKQSDFVGDTPGLG